MLSNTHMLSFEQALLLEHHRFRKHQLNVTSKQILLLSVSYQLGMISCLDSQTLRNMIDSRGRNLPLKYNCNQKSLSRQYLVQWREQLNLNLDISARQLQVIFLPLCKEFWLALISNNLKIYDISLRAQVEGSKPWLAFLHLASFRSLARHISTGWEEIQMHIKQVIKIRFTVSRGLVILYDLKMKIKITFEHTHSFDSNTRVGFDGTGSLPWRIVLSKLETIYIQRSCKSMFVWFSFVCFFVCLFLWGRGLSFSEIESVINLTLLPSQAF